MKWFRSGKLSMQMTVISCVCVLVVTLVLWLFMLNSFQNSAISTRRREAQAQCDQVVAQSERIAQMCNMSTQVYLNTPSLTEHLTALKRGTEMQTMDKLRFYREGVGSLEKVALSNPDFYQIRVYSVARDIDEMMPILYSAQRMEKLPWYGNTGWYLDFTDTLFDDSGVAEHLMSLITPIVTAEDGQLGTVEVCVRMERIFPGLFERDGQSWAVLLNREGSAAVGSCPLEGALLAQCAQAENGSVQSIGGQRVLVSRAELKATGCTYLLVSGLRDLDKQVAWQAIWLLLGLMAGFALLALLISGVTQKALQGFYSAFDGIRAFAEGDSHAQVPVRGSGEMADFARETNNLLAKIDQLMHDNMEREVQAQNSELRALHNQINAHFIYNVLEAIKMMAEIDEKYEIADALTVLGKLLRYGMKWEIQNVTVEQELQYVENYIALMNLRFDYRVTLDIQMPPEIMCQRLPKISLQPIVENAVVHGAAVLGADTVIAITGSREGGRCCVRISDEGKGMTDDQLLHLRRQISGEEPSQSHSGNGIGLHNVQERIWRSFGGDFGLEVTSQIGVGTTVTVALPYEEREGMV